MKRFAITVSALMIGTQLMAAGTDPQYIISNRSPSRAGLPFSDAVLVGNTLYVSGHIGIDPKTQQAAEDPKVEAKLVMDSVKQALESAGLTMDNLVSVTIYCTDLNLYDMFNAQYKTYFHDRYPARAFIGAAHLLRGAHFEVQGIAVMAPPAHKPK